MIAKYGRNTGIPEKTMIDLEKLEDSSHLLEILITCEDILDSMDMYVYPNWFEGEVIEGPIVRRHWVSVSLLYPHDKMPDPRAALRLLKHNVMVEFNKVRQNGKEFHPLVDQKTQPIESPSDQAADDRKPDRWFWMIKLNFPRRLMDQMGSDLDFYSDEVDVENVEDAKDTGIDNESAYSSDEQEPLGGSGGAPGAGAEGSEEQPFPPGAGGM